MLMNCGSSVSTGLAHSRHITVGLLAVPSASAISFAVSASTSSFHQHVLHPATAPQSSSSVHTKSQSVPVRRLSHASAEVSVIVKSGYTSGSTSAVSIVLHSRKSPAASSSQASKSFINDASAHSTVVIVQPYVHIPLLQVTVSEKGASVVAHS